MLVGLFTGATPQPNVQKKEMVENRSKTNEQALKPAAQLTASLPLLSDILKLTM